MVLEWVIYESVQLCTMDISFFDSDAFLIGYYVLTVGASLLLIKDTKKRVLDLKAGIGSIKYAPIAFGILAVYVLFAFEYVRVGRICHNVGRRPGTTGCGTGFTGFQGGHLGLGHPKPFPKVRLVSY